VLAAGDPAPGFDTEHTQVHRVAFRGHNAVFPNHAILLAARNDLPGEQQQRTFGIVDQYEAVHLSAVVANAGVWMSAANQSLHAARLGHNDLSRAQAFVESQELASRVTPRCNHRKNAKIPVTDGVKHFVAGSWNDLAGTSIALIEPNKSRNNQQNHESHNTLRCHRTPFARRTKRQTPDEAAPTSGDEASPG
jgi:hypothetical protein